MTISKFGHSHFSNTSMSSFQECFVVFMLDAMPFLCKQHVCSLISTCMYACVQLSDRPLWGVWVPGSVPCSGRQMEDRSVPSVSLSPQPHSAVFPLLPICCHWMPTGMRVCMYCVHLCRHMSTHTYAEYLPISPSFFHKFEWPQGVCVCGMVSYIGTCGLFGDCVSMQLSVLKCISAAILSQINNPIHTVPHLCFLGTLCFYYS